MSAADDRYVFLSYASADHVRALALADSLEAVGVRVWLDRSSIAGGTSWGSEIVEGIKGCAALLILCSAAAMRSRNVRQEIQLAWRYERAYVPLLLESVAFPEQVQYFLEGWQWVELLNQPESAWLAVLLKALARLGVVGAHAGAVRERPGSAVPSSAASAPVSAAGGSPTAPPQPSSVPADSVFVGRQDELGRLRSALSAAMAGQGRLLLLAGEPGIGKTRLAQALVADAAGRGCLVLWGRCWEGEGAPAFWPWVEALGAYARTREPAELRMLLGAAAPDLAQLVPEVRAQLPDLPEPAPVEPELARFRLFGGITELCRRLAVARPVVLVLDDLHWADKPSLLLLQFLARQLAAMPLLLLGTYRDTDLDRRHPLAEVLATLRREPVLERVSLHGLSRAAVIALLEARAGHRLDGKGYALAEAVQRETEGNPLFVGETLRHLVETGGIVDDAGRWTVTVASIADLRIPEGVREVIGRRLSRLSETCNQTLAVAAVMGREFNADVLERVSGQSADTLDEVLAEAIAAVIVSEPSNAQGRYRFSHALVRETLVQELPIRRRVRLHRQLGEALEVHYGVRADHNAAELAYHFSEAAGTSDDDLMRALRYCRLAAGQAEASTAWEEAVRFYEQCLSLLAEAEQAPTDAGEADLLAALARCQTWAGAPDAARVTLERAMARYRDRGDRAGFARAALQTTGSTGSGLHQRALCDAGLAFLGDGEPHLRALLLVAHSAWWFDAAADAVAEEAASLARIHGFDDVLHRLQLRDVMACGVDMQFEEAAARAIATHRTLVAADERMLAAEPLMVQVVALGMAGRLDEAEEAAAAALAYARGIHRVYHEQIYASSLAGIAALRCDTSGLEQWREQASDALSMRLVTAEQAAQQEDPLRALTLLPSPGGDIVVPPFSYAQVDGTRARLLLAAGDEAGARQSYVAFREHLGEAWLPSHYVTTFAALGEALAVLGDQPEIEATYRQLNAWAAVRCSGYGATRSMDSLRGALALRLSLIDEAKVHYEIGLAWAERERCPVEQGHCLRGLAEVAARHGQLDEARAYFNRAAALFEQHGAVFYLQQVRASTAVIAD